MSIVTVRNVTRRFGSFTAVDGVDLDIGQGEVVGILGANGAGKTTLMKMILGLLRPTAGSITLFGRSPGRETRRRIGYVPQDLGLWRDLTADENLQFSAGVFGVRPSPAPEGSGGRLVGDLSLGVQRRVAFAAALQHQPDLLILDEPTSGVAPLARARLWEEIRSRAEAGTTVAVTTHYMDEARQADRLVLMAGGRVIGTGSEADIVGSLQAVVVATDHWDAAFTALDEAGLAATMAGTDLRVPGAETAAVEAVLHRAGISAAVTASSATLEEAMVVAGTP
ncbi:MAG: ABC transporter ATP-binding protein [Actinobacteria bacterium]|nr:ABC transporter ATP-binding protein [Actinomycetota bacterium]